MSFRFLFSFFVMYMMADNAFPLIGELGFLDWMTELNQFVVWLGRHVLDVEQEISTESTGSGDTTFFYLQLYFFLVAAVFAASVWSILDRDRKEYNALHYWLMIGLRYYLAIHLWSYGFEKVYKLQFPTPSLERLVQPYGESTPMGLAWTFMGYSKLYNYFTGFAEVLGGALLLFRRTATLGALVSLLVMLNVAVMNFSFDIPVKLFSTTLAVMCLYLLTQQIKALHSFFIDHRLTKLTLFPVPFSQNKPLKTTSRILKYSWIGYELFNNISENRRWDIEQGDNAPKPPLYGIYYTENFVRNNDTLPPLATDSLYWKRMIVTEYGYASILSMNDTLRYYDFKTDTLKKQIEATSYEDSEEKHLLQYERIGKNHLLLTGKWKNDSISVRFRKKDVKEFPLVSTGFNWINEYPNNR